MNNYIINEIKLKKLDITVIVATKNEEKNLPRCLKSCLGASRVIVIDSKSTDGTASIVHDFGMELVQFFYAGGYPKKRQWALDNMDIMTPWVFLLDADEVITDKLWNEIDIAINNNTKINAYMITKGFHFLGKKMKFGGFSHAAVLLFKTNSAYFEKLFDDNASGLDMEIHERLIVNGEIGKLKNHLIHEDFKGLESYIEKHNKYSSWEAKLRFLYLTSGHYGKETIAPDFFGNSQERRRAIKFFIIRMPKESWFWFFWHYIIRLGILEGVPGLIACQIRSCYISQVKSKIFELSLGNLNNK